MPKDEIKAGVPKVRLETLNRIFPEIGLRLKNKNWHLDLEIST
jgi:hypothetical protein